MRPWEVKQIQGSVKNTFIYKAGEEKGTNTGRERGEGRREAGTGNSEMTDSTQGVRLEERYYKAGAEKL